MKTKQITIFFFILIVLSSLVIAIPPITTQVIIGIDEGIIIKYPPYTHLKQLRDYKLHLHVFNETDGVLLTNETTSCLLHLYNESGSHIVEIEQIGFDSNNNDFDALIGGGNFSDLGFVSYIIQCNHSNNYGGAVSGVFEITATGTEQQDFLGVYILFAGVGIFFILLALILFLDGRKQVKETKGAK